MNNILIISPLNENFKTVAEFNPMFLVNILDVRINLAERFLKNPKLIKTGSGNDNYAEHLKDTIRECKYARNVIIDKLKEKDGTS